MSQSNPYTASPVDPIPKRPGFPRPGKRKQYAAGVLALTWSAIAWAEWFLVPVFFPDDGSPVAHLAFVPQAILLILGCLAITLMLPLWSILTRCWWLPLCAIPAATYLVYQISRAL